MATKGFIKDIVEYTKSQSDKIDYNQKLFEIMEGNLLKYVEIALKQQLNPESAGLAMYRAAPINVWNKIIRKLSALYTKPVTRTTKLESDQDLIGYYTSRGIDKHFGNMNENFNSYKWSSLEIFEDDQTKSLRFRSIPSNQFLAYSDDRVDPMRPTAVIKFMGQIKTADGSMKNRYWVYTKDEFIPILEDETIYTPDLEGNDGVNPYGVMPIEYVSLSEYLLVPNPDMDTFQMTKLVAILIGDQNYGSMWLSFPILYTLNADSENLPASPNVFWNLKSDLEDKQASVGVVKAEPDLEAQMNHTIKQLALWMDSRDIKPGTIGKVSAENFSSGISKIISEMDTIENRRMQEMIFKEVENRFWKRLATMHNTLAKIGRIENRQLFSDPAKLNVTVEYSEEKVIETREDRVRRLKLEREAGFTSLKRSIRELNPSMDEAQVDALILEIDGERTIVVQSQEEETEVE